MRVELVRNHSKHGVVGIDHRVGRAQQLDRTSGQRLLFANGRGASEVAHCETHEWKRLPALEADTLTKSNVKWNAAHGYEHEHSAEVRQDLEVRVDAIAGHQERLIQQTALTLRDFDIELLTQALSQRLPKANILGLKARNAAQDG